MWTKSRTVVFVLLSFFGFVIAASPAFGQAQRKAQLQAASLATTSRGTESSGSVPEGRVGESSKYAGAEACKTCHEDLYNSWEKTPHWKTTLDKKGGPEKMGCEGCHGPGAAHAAEADPAKIVSFKNLSREQSSARCISCHGEAHEQSHFSESAHSGSAVGCLDCHSPHHAKQAEHLLVQSQPALCYSCHTAAKADFAKPFHHRVNEGLVECSDCHNVHGTENVRQVRALPSGDAVCFKCHVDKQGPFLFEHVPVKTEGCSSCHTPHGSTNPRFLRVGVINMMCLQCHTFPTASPLGPVHNQSQKYQACTMCHQAIHGSNFSNVFFK